MFKSLISVVVIISSLFFAGVITGDVINKQESNSLLQKKSGQLKQSGNFGNIPLYFIPNKGQVNPSVKFYAKTPNYTLWVTSEGLVFDKVVEAAGAEATTPVNHDLRRNRSDKTFKRNASKMLFVGAKDAEVILPGAKTEYRVNYFKGNDKSKWVTGVETSESVIYKNIYDGIDLKIYGFEKQIEYDWVVHPGADPGRIAFKYENVQATEISEDGNLIIHTELGDLVHKRPVSYQVIDGGKVSVNVSFTENRDGSYSFKVGDYNPDYALVIDPLILSYSTYIGGTNHEYIRSVAVDASGAAYITGDSSSSDYPLSNAYQNSNNGLYDVVVTKFSPAGDSLVYSTYIGGSQTEQSYGISVDTSGSAYIAGTTYSSNFPVAGPMNTTFSGGGDVFVARLSPSGNSLIYSNLFGGTTNDYGEGVDIDSQGAAYVCGYTNSSDFPVTATSYQTVKQSGTDIFVLKVNSTGSVLTYSTYLGGTEHDYGYGIKVDSGGNAAITGETNSMDYPLAFPLQPSKAGFNDIVITVLNSSGTSLNFSTYLGGSHSDYGSGITVDSSGTLYVTGVSSSSDFPVWNAYQSTIAGGGDCVLMKISAGGNGYSPDFITYFGGSDSDISRAVGLDTNGAIFITGNTKSDDFPVYEAYQSSNAGTSSSDVFVTKFSLSGDSLIYSTYIGGGGTEYGEAIALDSTGAAYVAGRTGSPDFPVVNAYQASNDGSSDGFVAKLFWQSPNTAPVAVIDADRFGGIAPVTINFDGTNSYDTDGTVTAWRWLFGDGANSTLDVVEHEYAQPGNYTVSLQVKDNDNVWSPFTTEEILILGEDSNLSCTLEVNPASIKANGRGSAVVSSVLKNDGELLLTDMGLAFVAESGELVKDKVFNSATGVYSQTLISGAPGEHEITARAGSTTLCSSTVEYTWPEPPVNAAADKSDDRGLFKGAYYVALSWSPNTADIYTPEKYKIYRSDDGGEWQLLAAVDADTLQYADENVPAGKSYRYGISTLDTEGDESDMVIIELE